MSGLGAKASTWIEAKVRPRFQKWCAEMWEGQRRDKILEPLREKLKEAKRRHTAAHTSPQIALAAGHRPAEALDEYILAEREALGAAATGWGTQLTFPNEQEIEPLGLAEMLIDGWNESPELRERLGRIEKAESILRVLPYVALSDTDLGKERAERVAERLSASNEIVAAEKAIEAVWAAELRDHFFPWLMENRKAEIRSEESALESAL